MAKKNKNAIEDRKLENQDREFSNRFEESRLFESRSAERRTEMRMTFQDDLYFPAELVPDGVRYKWIRTGIKGAPDNDRQMGAARSGWRAVPAERHPEFRVSDIFGRTSYTENCFVIGENVLCERPTRECEEEEARLNEHNHKILTSMQGLDNLLSEPNMPVFNNGTTHFGRSASMPKT